MTSSRIRLTRRAFTLSALALLGAGSAAGSAAAQVGAAQMSPEQQAALAAIQADFGAFRTMQGQFFQTNPDGSQGAGIFVIQRPGKMLFQYAPTTPGGQPPVEMICDGEYVAVIEREIRSQSFIPLGETPLRLLLADNVDLATAATIIDFVVTPEQIVLVLEDANTFYNGRLTLVFDGQTRALRQWTVLDANGLETTTVISEVQIGAPTDPAWFTIDYSLFQD